MQKKRRSIWRWRWCSLAVLWCCWRDWCAESEAAMMRKLLDRLLGVTMKTTFWLTLARLALSLGKKALKKR